MTLAVGHTLGRFPEMAEEYADPVQTMQMTEIHRLQGHDVACRVLVDGRCQVAFAVGHPRDPRCRLTRMA